MSEVLELYLRGYARGCADVFAGMHKAGLISAELAARLAGLWTEALSEAAEQSQIDDLAQIEALAAFDELLLGGDP